MNKKIVAVLSLAAFLFCFSACSIKKDNTDSSLSSTLTTFQQSTLYRNDFKDKLPDFKFDETPAEKYNDGSSYFFSVECSKNEYNKYVEKLKKCGFKNVYAESSGYFYALDNEKYTAELFYVDGVLTAKFGK